MHRRTTRRPLIHPCSQPYQVFCDRFLVIFPLLTNLLVVVRAGTSFITSGGSNKEFLFPPRPRPSTMRSLYLLPRALGLLVISQVCPCSGGSVSPSKSS